MNNLNNHTMILDYFPEHWLDGIPLGNGAVGIMLSGDKDSINFTLDHANAWDLRNEGDELTDPNFNYSTLRTSIENGTFDAFNKKYRLQWKEKNPVTPTKVNLGRLELKFERVPCQKIELALGDAIVTGRIDKKSDISFQGFVACGCNTFVFKMKGVSEEKLNYLPFYELTSGFDNLTFHKAEIDDVPFGKIILQKIFPDSCFGICYSLNIDELYVSFAYGKHAGLVREAVLTENKHAIIKGYQTLKSEHISLWHKFWSKSSISLPDKNMERAWYWGLYVLNSCSRKDLFPPGLQGVWATDGAPSCWRGDYHADMNIQETFAMACAANHLELLDVWLDYSYATLSKAEEFTRKFFGTGGAFQFCATLPGYVPVLSGWIPVNFAWSHTGWLAQLAWQRWRYSIDRKWLEEKGYPIMRSAFEFYAENLEIENDGKYHIPLSSSPEYDNDRISAWCKDPNIDIALIRKCCDWLIEMEHALNISRLSESALNIKRNLVEYHLMEFKNINYNINYQKVLALWENKLLDESHRHPSHLMAIYPAMDITIDGNENEKQIIADSYNQYLSLGQYFWAGHTYIQMISMSAVLGRGDMAYSFLKKFLDNWTLPNLLHCNCDLMDSGDSFSSRKDVTLFTIEAICGVTEGISNMLIQSWHGIIRLFPAIPAHWRNISFCDLLTEGAFEVSSQLENGSVKSVTIKGKSDNICRLKNPFGDSVFRMENCSVDIKNDIIEITILNTQQEAVLYS